MIPARLLLATLLASVPVSAAFALPSVRPAPPRTRSAYYAANELLVALGEAKALQIGAGARPEASEPALAATLERFGFDRAAAVGRSPRGGERSARFLKLSSRRADFDPLEAARALRATGRFRAVCPNYRLQLFATLPNDEYLDLQWYVSDPGDGDVDLPEAWDLEKGGSSVTIGIMDTGVDTGHPDLASRIWTNPGEIPGNSLDDDGNGYVDDVNGWDFGNDDSDPNPGPVIDEIGLDIGFHGTFVAGIASASTGNAEGIAGAGWNCRVLPLKVTNSAGEITSEAIAAAFLYAADLHVGVLNLSLGGPGDPGVPEFFQALVDVADSSGVLCVASAGNDGSSTPTYPAACDRVLAVAALDDANARTDFSNYGSWVDLAAPGASMWSAICRNYVVDDYSQVFYLYLFLWDGENPYMYGDGTSFSCPLVAGVCGLLRHRAPSLGPQQAAQHIVATGDPLSPSLEIGPKLNAFRAVSQPLVSVDDAPASALAFERVTPNPIRSNAVLAFTTAAPGRVRLTLYDCAGRRVRELVDESLPVGRHARAWDGAASGGLHLASGVYVAVLESGERSARQKLVLLR